MSLCFFRLLLHTEVACDYFSPHTFTRTENTNSRRGVCNSALADCQSRYGRTFDDYRGHGSGIHSTAVVCAIHFLHTNSRSKLEPWFLQALSVLAARVGTKRHMSRMFLRIRSRHSSRIQVPLEAWTRHVSDGSSLHDLRVVLSFAPVHGVSLHPRRTSGVGLEV